MARWRYQQVEGGEEIETTFLNRFMVFVQILLQAVILQMCVMIQESRGKMKGLNTGGHD